MTEDISKLVNLTSLSLMNNSWLGNIPESIGSLQQLSRITISGSPIKEVPFGLGRLANLAVLDFEKCGPLHFPRSLQVSDFDCCRRLTVVFEWSQTKRILQGRTGLLYYSRV